MFDGSDAIAVGMHAKQSSSTTESNSTMQGSSTTLTLDVPLVARDALGSIALGLTKLSDKAWEYVLMKFYTHERMTLDELALHVAVEQTEALRNHAILWF